ncbi:rRNA methylase [Pediococcus damnosus]|uniref:rRNA methylase n=1 Tax=Pediococcus damnosus TaxID=51663 RepID=A0A0R2HTG7_9LACO|nr:RNA methyltransferase [Pediococcus damnosus]AMV61372.1 rRNA methylase [Pediococcus damnosus]AMV62272.1 rRNA methylase [Pediococcus damnosus]AMV65731.1 rRNA methylase [Pediococcus damnosus]AMV67869.1 rRNA methylase [Pediococcus damnosus]AMV70073.1 rRNA methylase [Pediococcus damnosus]
METILSTQNNRVKEWEKLKTKKGRKKTGMYIIEGRHLVNEVLQNEADVVYVVATQDELDEIKFDVPEDLLVIVSDKIADRLSDTVTTQGIFAIVRIPNKERQIQDPDSDVTGAWLLLDNIQDPGNIGTMVRTADAAGFQGVIFGKGTADIFNPKIQRAMQGSQFHIRLVLGNLEEWIKSFKTANIPVFGTELNPQAKSYKDIDTTDDFALIMGNEGNGMSQELLSQTTANLYIPIKGQAESLNVAVAAGILMFSLRNI